MTTKSGRQQNGKLAWRDARIEIAWGDGRVVRGHVEPDEFYARLRISCRERGEPRRWMTFRKD